jgi:radical SAM protein with 4Fe4S-binding SPASM domain
MGTMDFEMFRGIVEQCTRLGIHELHLHNFGEPLLDRALVQKIKYAKDRNIGRVVIFTNGSLLNERRCAELIDSGLDEVTVSIDGATKLTYERSRRGLKFDDVVSNTLYLQQLKRRSRSLTPHVTVHSVLTDESMQEASMLRKFWMSHVDNWSVEFAHNWGTEESVKTGYASLVRNGQPFRYPCEILWKTAFVLWNGDVSICCLDFNGETIVGNIEKSSIEEIWNNELYRLYRKFHLNREFDRIPLCAGCLYNSNPFAWW